MADVIGRGDISGALKRAFDLRARVSYQLAGEVVPVAGVADLEGPPYHWKAGFSHGIRIAAGGAGTNCWFVIRMPSGSKNLGVVRHIIVQNDAAGIVYAQLMPLVAGDLPGGLSFTGILEDWDVRGVRADNYHLAEPLIATGTPLNNPTSRSLGVFLAPAYTQARLDGPWVFSADHWLAVASITEAQQLTLNIYGDVYPG